MFNSIEHIETKHFKTLPWTRTAFYYTDLSGVRHTLCQYSDVNFYWPAIEVYKNTIGHYGELK